MSSDPKQCETTRHHLAANLGRLEGDQSESLGAHLEACGACRAYAQDCRALARAGHALAQGGYSEAEAEATVQRLARRAKANVVAEQGEPQPFWRSLPQWGLPALSASISAAAVILLVGLAGIGERSPDAVRRKAPVCVKRPQGGGAGTRAGAVGPLSRLIVVGSSYAADTAIPVDLAVLGDRALAPALVGSGARGSRQREKTP